MKLCMVGTGYVGLVSGVCFSDLGNEVVCVDKDKNKIDLLKKGKIPIYEPGLSELAIKNYKNKRLTFSSDLKSLVTSESRLLNFSLRFEAKFFTRAGMSASSAINIPPLRSSP